MDLQGQQFGSIQHEFVPAGTRHPNEKVHRLEARQGDRTVGYVSWHPGNNTIYGAWTDDGRENGEQVRPSMQGQGIATGLVRDIAENHMPVYPNGRKAQLNHSTKRSPAGDALARKTQDITYVPRNENARKGQKYLSPGAKYDVPFTPDI
jgi:GNAT superfamily N-acetyltransferase